MTNENIIKEKHCCNDPVFGYCIGEPNYDEQPQIKEIINPKSGITDKWLVGGHCKNIKSECLLFRTGTQITKQVEGLSKAKFILNPTNKEKTKLKSKENQNKPVQTEMF